MSAVVSEHVLSQAVQLVKNSKSMVVLTGAGVSVPSGVADFRSSGTGLWTKNDPMEVASLSAFRFHPEKFFNWLRPLAQDILQARPNPAHTALAALERVGVIKTLITQNIDSLHQRAGSQNVVEIHGTIYTLTCSRCDHSFPLADFREPFIQNRGMPNCPNCGALLKPDIVLFQENLPEEAWFQAERACAEADLMLVVGSSLEVYPAASLPLIALESGAPLMINTLSSTPLDERAALLLPYDAAQFLPLLAEKISGRK